MKKKKLPLSSSFFEVMSAEPLVSSQVPKHYIILEMRKSVKNNEVETKAPINVPMSRGNDCRLTNEEWSY